MGFNKKECLLECDCCYQEYFDVISPTQAEGCASEIIIKEHLHIIYSDYGSIYNTYRFSIPYNNKLIFKPNGTLICDDCIDVAIKNNIIQILE